MERKGYLDVLKGIGIVFVVLGHTAPELSIEKFIYSFHMFLFFFLAGTTFQTKGIKLRVISDTKSILIPFLFWNGIAEAISLAFGGGIQESLKSLLFLGKVSWNSPVWFLIVIFWVRLLGEITLKNAICKTRWILLTACLVLNLYLGYIALIPPIFGWNIVPIAFSFFLLGYMYEQQERCLKQNIAVLLLVINICLSQMNDRISVYGNYYGNYIVAIAGGICGVVGSYSIVKNIYKKRKFIYLEKLGKCSFNIMCSHYFVLGILRSVSNYLFEFDIWKAVSTTKAVAVTAAILVLEWLIECIMKRYKVPDTCLWRQFV